MILHWWRLSKRCRVVKYEQDCEPIAEKDAKAFKISSYNYAVDILIGFTNPLWMIPIWKHLGYNICNIRKSGWI